MSICQNEYDISYCSRYLHLVADTLPTTDLEGRGDLPKGYACWGHL